MPVVGLSTEELFARYGAELPHDELENELHRFGCSVEGWATVRRYRCERCNALSEVQEHELPPAACESCGAVMRGEGREPELAGEGRVLKMELLAVRPDLFDPAGLARALRGFLGREAGAPAYALAEGDYTIDVDPALEGPEVRRPRIVGAVVRGLRFEDASLRSLMKLQENIHWALGRDRKLASIGVYDLDQVEGTALSYRAVGREELSFVPLGYDTSDEDQALTPERILAEHPKGKSFARLLEGCARVPLLADEKGGVLSMPPIINSEATRVHLGTRDVFIDVTGLEDRHIERALSIVVTSLLETCPEARAESVTVRYEAGEARRTPDFTPQVVEVDPGDAARLIGVPWTPDEVVELLRRMRHDARLEGSLVRVEVPAWRADIVHPRDLYEDVAIAHGYDNIEERSLESATFGQAHPRERLAERARRALVGLGALEVMTLTLTSEQASFERCRLPRHGREVRIEHPISIEQTMLRVSLIPGLMETLALNLTHAYPQRIFEVGSIAELVPEAETGADERLFAALASRERRIGYADVRSLADALLGAFGWAGERAPLLRPVEGGPFLEGRGAEVVLNGQVVGQLGEVHPEVLEAHRIIHPVTLFEFDLEALEQPLE